jgi:hypothetical protein
MPSLIYIARIKNLPEELSNSLRSAGCHVKLFKPGDITQDECLLAMTSEAIGATLDPEGAPAESGRILADTPAAADMAGQVGSQAAIWNSIKTAVTNQSQAKDELVTAVASTFQPHVMEVNPGSTEAERQTVSPEEDATSGEAERIELSGIAAARLPNTPKNVRPAEQVYRVLRNPLSTVVGLLLFAVIYRGFIVPSKKSATVPGQSTHDARSYSATSLLTVNAAPGRTAHRSIPAEPSSQTVNRVQRHLSHDDSVAEDFTNHLVLHAQGGVTQRTPEAKRLQIGSLPKRIVID